MRYDPDDCRTWTDEEVQRLLDAPEAWLRKWATKELSRRRILESVKPENLRHFDHQGPRDRKGRTEHNRLLAKIEEVLKRNGLRPETRARIGSLVDTFLVPGCFREGPEGKRVAEILRAILDPEPLLNLLREAEAGKRLRPGVAEAVQRAHRDDNPYLQVLRTIEWALGLEVFHPTWRRLFHRGRPSEGKWAFLADAVADEVKRERPKRVWPVVAETLRPLLPGSRTRLLGDAESLRKLAVRWKRQVGRQPWEQGKADLRKAGLEESPTP